MRMKGFTALNNSYGWFKLSLNALFYLLCSFVCKLIKQQLMGDVSALINPVFVIPSTYDLWPMTGDQRMTLLFMQRKSEKEMFVDKIQSSSCGR